MFVFANFLMAVTKVLDVLLTAYMWVVVISALISWVNPDPYNPIVRFLHSVTEPVLRPIRRRIGFMGPIDLSPLIVVLVIIFLQYFLINSLYDIAIRLRQT